LGFQALLSAAPPRNLGRVKTTMSGPAFSTTILMRLSFDEGYHWQTRYLPDELLPSLIRKAGVVCAQDMGLAPAPSAQPHRGPTVKNFIGSV